MKWLAWIAAIGLLLGASFGLRAGILHLGKMRPSSADSLSEQSPADLARRASKSLPFRQEASSDTTSKEQLAPLDVRRADYAITKIELDAAEMILEGEVGPEAARARARLAIYRADCEGALSHLASEAARRAKGAQQLLDLATRCKGATAGAVVIQDEDAGVWIRVQDESDKVLAPLIIEVAERARLGLEKDLGVDLPRPLRIDLVRDLFSLSAVSGLPLEAAETTGTVAVARWGRVTMVSPRAMQRGFPWADTLAHEITHLLLSRASADRAPLWLQEGIAKREEHRWRQAYPFDDDPDFSEKAYRALRDGKAVGVDSIGPSIAMLPSAEAASIAFAEVTSYMDFWIAQNGPHALSLLLAELEVAPDEDTAMRGVSGYSVSEWQVLWREELAKRFAEAPISRDELEPTERLGPHAVQRSMRLTELLTLEGFFPQAAELSAPDLDRASHVAALRFMTGRAALLAQRDDADELLGSLDQVDAAHPGWLALRSRRRQLVQTDPEAALLLAQATELDPLLPEVACGGTPWVGKTTTNRQSPAEESEPAGEDSPLCAHARSLPLRGSR